MPSFLPFFVLIIALAGRVFALNIVFGGTVGNITASQFLDISDEQLKADCQAQCDPASSAVQSCSDSNDACLCTNDTISKIVTCEQCMFTDLINKNQKSSDPKAGSTPGLQAYAAACLTSQNITIPATTIALAPPSSWDGPFDAILNLPSAIFTVIVGFFLGSGLIYMLKRVLLWLRNVPPSSALSTQKYSADSSNLFCRHKRFVLDPSHLSTNFRNFCLSHAQHNVTASLHNITPPRHLATQLAYPAGRLLTAAEREWLQAEGEVQSTFPPVDYPAPPRFDWRMRATSRAPKRATLAGDNIPTGAHDGHRSKLVKREIPPFICASRGEPFYEEIQSYQDRFLSLLDSEQAEDEAVLRERLSTWTLDRLKEEGYALTGLSSFWFEANQFGRPVASFLLGPGITLPGHRFENGTQVLVSRMDPLKEVPIKGSVLSHTATQLRISFQERFDLDGIWRLDVGRSNIVYERMRTAISYFNHDPSSHEHCRHSAPDRQLIIQGTHLRDILLRTFSPSNPVRHAPLQAPDEIAYPEHDTLEHSNRQLGAHAGAFSDDMRIRSWVKRYAEPNPIRVEGDPILLGLNETQTRAVALMIGERISLVQGPPGTGKTKTIIETVKLLKVHFEVVHPILVCTYTNVAVDNLVEGLASSGVKPLRVGFGGRVKSSLVPYTLDQQLEDHPLRPQVDKLVEEEASVVNRMEALEKKITDLTLADKSQYLGRVDRMTSGLSSVKAQVDVLRRKIYAMRQQMLREVVSQADVICTTCITSACAALNVVDFPVVFIDEASMSTEPASLIPIMKGSRHLALIGDHKQLPPVITSAEAQAKGLGISLFERLTEERVVPSIMLDIQYRMHPSISRFPSSEFYNFSLRDGTRDDHLIPPNSSHLEIDSSGKRPSVVFLDHFGSESTKDRSKVNWNEAHIVCSVVEDLLLQNENLRGQDIGIIAPYVAQISLLTRLFNNNAKYRQRFNDVLGSQRAMQLANIEIKTVDGFEGREKDIIIFSTVRNNSSGYIGFLADRRRLNVGLTRAKRGLFVVGSLSTLKAGKMGGRNGSESGSTVRVGKGGQAWRRYAEFLSNERLVLTLSGDRLRRTLYGNLPNAKGSAVEQMTAP